MISEEDVQRYAEFIVGHPEAVHDRHREAARAVLSGLERDGRLLPPGGVARTEYGADVSQWNSGCPKITSVGGDLYAQKHSTHQRQVISWVSEGPNDDWPRYTTGWVEKDAGQQAP